MVTARRYIAGALPLAHAAAQAGFADQSHMTRTFAARFGITPGGYRRSVRGDAAAIPFKTCGPI